MSQQIRTVNEVNARLTRETGVLAGRLAQFLATSLASQESSIAAGQQFLQAFFEAVAEGRPLESWSRNPLERAPQGEPHPLDRLARSLALTPAEVELLLLSGLSEEHEGLGAILRNLHPRSEPRVTVGLAAQLLYSKHGDRDVLRELIESSTVITSGALQVGGEGSFFERSLLTAESLWPALHGIETWPSGVIKLESPIVTLGLDEWFETSGVARAETAIRQGKTCTVMITADNEDTAFHRGLALVAHAGAKPIGFTLQPGAETRIEKLIQVHALARGVVPVLKSQISETAPSPASQLPAFENFPGVIVGCGRSGAAATQGRRPLVLVAVERLLPKARVRLWRETIPAMAVEAPALAARFPVEPAMAAEVASDLTFVTELEKRQPTLADVATSIRGRGSISLSAGVNLIRPKASWKDLVLPPDRIEQLSEAVSRLELQGQVFDDWGFLRERAGARGVRLLFSGPPGTGKTLSAEVLASALRVDLLIVDLSRVVSKWIGETEKNLAAVFDAAERAQAALFFDEADALFGKRTEVTDAHDRYANLETAYLLTRLERFEGLAILATNLRQNIDPAFLRRLEFVVDFEDPDREERMALWNCHLPNDVPLAEDVNIYELAALYPVVGGVIRNAAVAAAFLAAADRVPIDRHHFIHAIRREYAKAGRSFPGAPIGLVVR